MLTICSDEVASVCVTICLCCCAYVAVAINRRACNWTYMRLTGRSPVGAENLQTGRFQWMRL